MGWGKGKVRLWLAVNKVLSVSDFGNREASFSFALPRGSRNFRLSQNESCAQILQSFQHL